jgi:ABC-type lipoprotein export system ATPase subunit
MTATSIETRDVSRTFRVGAEDVHALRGVSLTVAPREFVALIGRSGSGKTTLLNIIAGLDRPSEGEVLFDGERIDNLPEAELTKLRRRDLGFVFQSFGLLPLLSATENVELPLRIAGASASDRSRRAKNALDLVGLTRRANHRPYELSGGEQQRVAIARAIATEPRLILADEPTGELDSTTARAIFGLLRALAREQDITVITCTHDRLVMELADRVEELADGQLLAQEDRKLWKRVQEQARSPFEAARGIGLGDGSEVEDSELSSLVGQDARVFAAPGLSRDGDGQAPSLTEEVEAAEEPPEEDAARWARPGKR